MAILRMSVDIEFIQAIFFKFLILHGKQVLTPSFIFFAFPIRFTHRTTGFTNAVLQRSPSHIRAHERACYPNVLFHRFITEWCGRSSIPRQLHAKAKRYIECGRWVGRRGASRSRRDPFSCVRTGARRLNAFRSQYLF